MTAKIKRFQLKEKQEKQQDLLELLSILERFPELNERKISSLLWEVKRKNKINLPEDWTFIMISPEQNLVVVNWLISKSKRPLNAVKLWALLFDNVHRETGQIMLTRQELANKLNVHAANVTHIMKPRTPSNSVNLKRVDCSSLRIIYILLYFCFNLSIN